MNSIDVKTREVIDMYNRFPFPLKGNYGNYFSKYVLPSISAVDCKRILDAGCGTGNISLAMARLLPEARIVAIDLTSKSLEIATQRAAKEGLKNIEFRRVNLLEFDPTLGIFDFIYCQGVIHSLTDPLSGLRNLNRYLKPSGYAHIWLYSYLGRTRVLEIREALKVLGMTNEWEWEEKLNLANRIDNLFYKGTWLKKFIYALEYLDRMGFKRLIHLFFKNLRIEIYLSDQILHPLDKFYRFSEAIELFDAGGFKFIKVLEGMSNTLEESFKDPEVLSIAYRLPPLERYKIIELYERPRGIGYLLRKHKDV
ncbi:MAG: putative methyltransferase YcgJ [candidate division WS2 bacterium]|nr:putative methyltransferase YcgJ [Candidatus Psychracetigena formicireducens]